GGWTVTGAIVGTAAYMAPEQAAPRGGPLTTAADVYALGAILYELLTGRPPFRGATPLATLLQVREQAPPRPRSGRRGIGLDLGAAGLKCLDKDPARRYASAAELAEDLENWLAGNPLRARRAGPVARLRKWARRNRGWAAAIAVGVLALLLGVGLI